MARVLYALTSHALTSSNIDEYFQTCFTVRIRRTVVIMMSLKNLPHLKCVDTLPCEISVS